MASITEHIVKLQDLTQKNLEILQGINDAFFSNNSNTTVTVDDKSYIIPSFIALENKINLLTANFDNLVNLPKIGEAYINVGDGARNIIVNPYESAPERIQADIESEFYHEESTLFRDMVTPKPYLKMNIAQLPKHISKVLVKKIIFHNDELKDQVISVGSVNPEFENVLANDVNYSSVSALLSVYKKNIDYEEYDSILDIPINSNIGYGSYLIKDIIEDYTNENLEQIVTFSVLNSGLEGFENNLAYNKFDGQIKVDLQIGDLLVTGAGDTVLEITYIDYENLAIAAKVKYGEYINLVSADTSNGTMSVSDMSVLKYYNTFSTTDNYVKIPLENDQHIYIVVAAFDHNKNIRGPWNAGKYIDTTNLLNADGLKFQDYYEDNVKNLGAVLYELTETWGNPVSQFRPEDFEDIISYVPTIDVTNLQVVRINSHLDNSNSVTEIKKYYAEKKQLQTQLSDLQIGINDINSKLSSTAYNDAYETRENLKTELDDLIKQRDNLYDSYSKVLGYINTTAKNSEVPIENAKYRIRGFFDYQTALDNFACPNITPNYIKKHIKGIKVQYRYKSPNVDYANELSIKDKFVFSNWVSMNSIEREVNPIYDGGYKFELEADNGNQNEISFNQIDIPISQGETVDIRLKLIYDFGYPFVVTTSDWSPVANIKFPTEFLQDLQLLDIINKNTSDIETSNLDSLIRSKGIYNHVEDKLVDNDLVYFHDADRISSGFYTPERRVIPLKDKLMSIDNELSSLKSDFYGVSNTLPKIYIKHNGAQLPLNPHQTAVVPMESYANCLANHTGNLNNTGVYALEEIEEGKTLVSTIINLSINNESTQTAKLYSLFPGNWDTPVNKLINYKFKKSDYDLTTSNNPLGVWFEHPESEETLCSRCSDEIGGKVIQSLQGGNQFIYFRVNDLNTGEAYYGLDNLNREERKDGDHTTGQLSASVDSYSPDGSLYKSIMYVYPKLSSRYGLCIENTNNENCLNLDPGAEIIIPIAVRFYVNNDEITYMDRTISFDLYTSLYKDPINYSFKVTVKYSASALDGLISNNQNMYNNNDSKYNPIIK